MLPGHRQLSNADIKEQIDEALDVFGEIDQDGQLPDNIAPIVFQSVLHMVGLREVPAGGIMHIPRGGAH